MIEYPAEQVEAIIHEEMMRGHGTTQWTTPDARMRYTRLFTELVVAHGDRREIVQQLRRVAEAERAIAPFCTEKPHIFAFSEDGLSKLLTVLSQAEDALGATLARIAMWPVNAIVPHATGEAYLQQTLGDIAELRRGTRGAMDQKEPMHVSYLTWLGISKALMACYPLFMTRDEAMTFHDFLNRAQERARYYSPQMTMPADVNLH